LGPTRSRHALAMLLAASSSMPAAAQDGEVVLRCAPRTVTYRWPFDPATLPGLPRQCRVAGRAAAAQALRPLPVPQAPAEPAAAPRAWVVPPQTQRQRDAEARELLLAEMRHAEARLAGLQSAGAADASATQAARLRLEQDLAALRRELARRP
jgi:hypothetical protein